LAPFRRSRGMKPELMAAGGGAAAVDGVADAVVRAVTALWKEPEQETRKRWSRARTTLSRRFWAAFMPRSRPGPPVA